jgi:2-oxoglutarate ferredoxin oxidoreductase subunit gamma
MRLEVRIAGFGGQGVGLAGYILGKALTVYDDYEAVMTQAYGPEARGGASSADIVVSYEPIDYPFVQHPDILVILSQEAYTKFRPTAKPDAIILVDEDLVEPEIGDNPKRIPATRIAEGIGRRIVANLVILGFFVSASGLGSPQAVEKAIKTTVKPKTVALNLEAFEHGLKYAHAQVMINE